MSEGRVRRKSQKKEGTGTGKGKKVAKHCVFPMICGSGEWKSRLAKAAGVEPSGQMRDEKLHASAAQSTFASEGARNTSRSERFWNLQCGKSAYGSDARHRAQFHSSPFVQICLWFLGVKINGNKCSKHAIALSIPLW